MRHTSICLGAIAAALAFAQAARADWDDRPGFDFHPQVSAEAPCGVGTPPRGHFPLEVSPTSLPDGLKLAVRQDAHRLCYVTGNLAEAPTLRIRQGADFTIDLRNEITDPAAIANFVTVPKLDTPNPVVPAIEGYFKVIPGHTHQATGATNLHLHGFAVPPVVPQDEVLKTCADPAVGPATCGQREITYHFHVPETMPAGLYWYHPHIHGEVHAQMLMGLSGAIVVEGPEDDARRAAGIRDRIFIVRQSQDIDVKTPAPAPAQVAPEEVPQGRAEHRPREAAGRVDTEHELDCAESAALDEITLNGAKVLDGMPADGDVAQIKLAAGTTQLWRVLNAANDAFLDLALVGDDGVPLPITVVARDGAPLTDDAGNRLKPVPTPQSQPVPPSGRVEFLVTAPPVDRKVYFVTHAVDTGCAGDKVPERRLALVTTIPTALAAATAAQPAPAAAPPPDRPNYFSGLLSKPTETKRALVLTEYPRPGQEDQTDFYIMERKAGAEMQPYRMDGPPLITVKAGTTEEWDIENWTRELHAFHLHQVHFRVLSIDGKPVPDTPLLDVVTVPYGMPVAAGHEYDGPPVVPGRVHIKVTFPDELAGDIPFHCHLTDHEDNGMMAVLRVVPAKLGLLDDPAHRNAGGDADWWEHPPICTAGRTPSPQQSSVPLRQSIVPNDRG
jgi:FtsP/CotA-like multicopper oxidase with cupredoxin domain